MHGLAPALHTSSIRWGQLADWDPANWALVLLATPLPVGSIYFGSDLVAKVLHHYPESADSAEVSSAQSVSRQADESAGQEASEQAARSAPDQVESALDQLAESTSVEVAEAPVARPTETDESAPAPAARPPRSESSGAAPRQATGRGPATAKSTADRTRSRTDAEVLDEARLLTAAWGDDELTAERLRTELRVGQKRARVLRNQLRAERTSHAEPVVDDGFEAEPLESPEEATPQPQRELSTAPADAA